MSLQKVLLVPDPRLKKVCAPVENFDDDLRALLQDLEDTRIANSGCVGIASPQIGVLARVAIVNTSAHKKFGAQSSGHLVLVNPIITRREGERLGREGCLSLPDFPANVRRSMSVEVEYSDAGGVRRVHCAQDFEAVVIQHELDHLDGTKFPSRPMKQRANYLKSSRRWAQKYSAKRCAWSSAAKRRACRRMKRRRRMRRPSKKKTRALTGIAARRKSPVRFALSIRVRARGASFAANR
jgi:peptide deformylase